MNLNQGGEEGQSEFNDDFNSVIFTIRIVYYLLFG